MVSALISSIIFFGLGGEKLLVYFVSSVKKHDLYNLFVFVPAHSHLEPAPPLRSSEEIKDSWFVSLFFYVSRETDNCVLSCKSVSCAQGLISKRAERFWAYNLGEFFPLDVHPGTWNQNSSFYYKNSSLTTTRFFLKQIFWM